MSWWRPLRRVLRKRAVCPSRVVERIAELGFLLESGPRPEFRKSLRAQLLREYAAQRAREPRTVIPARRATGRRPAAPRRPLLARCLPALVFLTLLGAMFGMGVQTYHSVPGEALYPLKRAAEATVLSLAFDQEDLARREMIAARLRAAETATLVTESPPGRGRLIRQTLDDMETTTRAALSRVTRKSEAAGEVRRFAREQRTLVEPLLPKLDRENRDKANQYLSYIDSFTSSGR